MRGLRRVKGRRGRAEAAAEEGAADDVIDVQSDEEVEGCPSSDA